MAAEPLFEPAFEARSLDKVEPGQLVRFDGGGDREEHAFTALIDEKPYLIVLDANGDEGNRYPPFVRSSASQPLVVVYPTWRIEPAEIIVSNASNHRRDGVIIVSDTNTAFILASADNLGGYGRSTRFAIDLKTGAALSSEAYGTLRQDSRFVAVTKWNIRVPSFGDDERIASRSIIRFPK